MRLEVDDPYQSWLEVVGLRGRQIELEVRLRGSLLILLDVDLLVLEE